MLLVTRRAGDRLAPGFLCPVAFYEFAGARDPEVSDRLRQAFARDRGAGVKSVRTTPMPKTRPAGFMAMAGACHSANPRRQDRTLDSARIIAPSRIIIGAGALAPL